jgi:hypothetical protein
LARLINKNISEKLPTKAEQLSDSYSKLRTHELKLITPEIKQRFSDLKNTTDILKPVLGKKDFKSKDMLNELKSSGRGKFIKNLDSYESELTPFTHSEDKGMQDLIAGKTNYGTDELESVLKDSRNNAALMKLPQPIKNKIFARLLYKKTNENLNTRAEKITDAYSKMNNYERSFADEETRKTLDNISKRVEQLKPVYTAANNLWKHFHKMKWGAVALGVPYHMLHLSSPAALGAVAAGTGAARFLGSKKLIEAYMGGRVPGASLPGTSQKIVRAMTPSTIGSLNEDNSKGK